jgi:hypothetical protein
MKLFIVLYKGEVLQIFNNRESAMKFVEGKKGLTNSENPYTIITRYLNEV